MATRIWDNGNNDRVVATAANWSDNTAPVSTDDIEFKKSGGTTASANVTPSGLSAVSPASVVVYADYVNDGANTGTIGTSAAAPLVLGTTTLLRMAGGVGSKLYLQSTVTTAYVDTDGEFFLGLGTLTSTTLNLIRGRCNLGSSHTFTTTHVGSQNGTNSSVFVTIDSGATLTTVNQRSGTVSAASLPGTLNVSGGLWTQTGPNSGSCALTVDGTGRVQLQTNTNTISSCTLAGSAVLDLSKATGAITFSAAIQIRSDAVTLILDPNKKCLPAVALNGKQPRIIWATGTTLTPS